MESTVDELHEEIAELKKQMVLLTLTHQVESLVSVQSVVTILGERLSKALAEINGDNEIIW